MRRDPRTLPRRVLQVIREQALWQPGDRVVAAASGGVDSTVLVEILAMTIGAHRGRITVMGLDHGLRSEALQELALVRAQAERLGLPFHQERLEIPPGPDLARRARDARRAALLKGDPDVVATGHQMDDQAETVLQRLLRGSGTRGLSAMQPRQGRFCRPLLFEDRATIVAFAELHRLAWAEDPSNPRSERGAIRRLMPELERLRPGAAEGLSRSARLLARDDALLDQLAEQAWARHAREGGLDLEGLRGEHPAIGLRLLLRLVEPCAAPVRADQLEAVLSATFRGIGRLQLPGEHAIELRGGIARLVRSRS